MEPARSQECEEMDGGPEQEETDGGSQEPSKDEGPWWNHRREEPWRKPGRRIQECKLPAAMMPSWMVTQTGPSRCAAWATLRILKAEVKQQAPATVMEAGILKAAVELDQLRIKAESEGTRSLDRARGME